MCVAIKDAIADSVAAMELRALIRACGRFCNSLLRIIALEIAASDRTLTVHKYEHCSN